MKSPPRLTVALLWQGAAAERMRNYLRGPFKDWWDKTNGDSATLEFRDVRDEPRGARRSFLDAAVVAMTASDCVIAIQGPEDRTASSAGNLWLEVGFWVADRGRDGLFILQMKKTGRRGRATAGSRSRASSANVVLPSNIGGWMHAVSEVMPPGRLRAKDRNSPLNQEIARWLVEQSANARSVLESEPRDEASASFAKVGATLGSPFQKWLKQYWTLSRMCPIGDGAEVAEPLIFVAELLRMGRSVGELADIASQLHRVSRAARLVASASTERVPPGDAWLTAAVDELKDELIELRRIAAEELKPRPGLPDAGPFARLEAFLGYRLQPFLATRGSEWFPLLPSLPDRDLADLIRSTRTLSDLGGAGNLLLDLQSANARKRSRAFEIVQKLSQDAFAFGRFLDDVRARWFEGTRTEMERHFRNPGLKRRTGGSVTASDVMGATKGALASLSSMTNSLASLCKKLPHNRSVSDGGWPIRIWRPRDDEPSSQEN